MNKRVTICDIAEAAGVSSCCVSWVLRDHHRSRDMNVKTRQRILDAAAKLGYVQNQLASAVRTGQVNTIAVILSYSKYQTIAPFSQVMTGIMFEASERRWSVKIFSEDKLDDSFQQIVENRISKVLMMSVNDRQRERAAELAEKYSLYLVYAFERGIGRFPAVNADNVETASNMVRYLAAHGHSRIGLLCVPHSHCYQEDRHAGYLKGMVECGLKTDPRWIRCSEDTHRSLEEIFALPAKQRPTALVALSDSIAAKVQSYAMRSGMDFPKDISVIGIGDTDIAWQLPYPLTTMRESLQETGKLLVRLLMKDPIDIRPDEFNVYHTHSVLVERESVFNINNQGRKK